MAKTTGIRRLRLLTIVLLGVLTSAVSLLGLVRVLHQTAALRVERGRTAVAEELSGLAERAPANSGVIGVRGGIVEPGAHPVLPGKWSSVAAEAIDESATSGSVAEREIAFDDSTIIAMARPATEGGTAWAVYAIGPPTYLPFWRAIVILLAIATTLLVLSSIYVVVTVTRGASDLNRSLVALATDLHAPIPRPAVRELAEIAEGISGLAESLAVSRAAEAELSRELAAKERLAALGRVVAGVAHEVRNPLASIKLRLDLASASKGAQTPEVVTRAITHASSEIARLDRLVADLLVVSGRALGPRAVVSLGDLVRSRVDALTPWAKERGVRLHVSGDASAFVDSDSLARAVDNLVRNATEASRSGGEVEAIIDMDGPLARVTITDHGEGVPAPREKEVFEPFFTTKPDGTGLGLALSRAIARAHGGDLTYARVGNDTRFSLSVDPEVGHDRKSFPISTRRSRDAA